MGIHRGVGHTDMTASRQNIFDTEKLTNFSCVPDGVQLQTSGLWISSPTLYQWEFQPCTPFSKSSGMAARDWNTALQRRNAAAYMAGSLKTVAHAIFSPHAVYLYLYMYRCGCTYRVTLRVFSWGTLQQQQQLESRTRANAGLLVACESSVPLYSHEEEININ